MHAQIVKKFLFLFLIFFSLNSVKAEGPKVYDCFTFFNELELLELRLDELYPVVDHFVIVESSISYTGKAKPLYYYENRAQFEKYSDKIIHIVIDSFPDLINDEQKDHWQRESYSRNAILEGLKNCKDCDIVFISDLDEIPRAQAVLDIKSYLSHIEKLPKKIKKKLNDSSLVCGLDMRLFMYFMNRENPSRWCGGSKAIPYWLLRKYSPWEIKIFHHNHSMKKILNAGWHFNTMGGMEKALEKWLNTGPTYYEGSEEALEELKNDPEKLRESFYNQVLSNTVLVEIDDTYPKYFLNKLEYFREIGWLDERHLTNSEQ